MLKVKLLGQFDVSLEGAALAILSRPAQSLLAYLTLNAGIAQRREKLAGLLWPESTEASARSNLRHALWRLRKAVGTCPQTGHDYLRADDLTITFDDACAYWLDAAVVDQKVAEGWTVEHLIEVVSVYEGELLPGFYDEWVTLERERLRAAFEHKMGLLLERLAEEGRWGDVLEWGERWIALGQVPEPAYRALMVAHGGLGDQSSVATVYQRCVEALGQELGVEPSEKTRETYERLLKGELPIVPAAVGTILERELRVVGECPYRGLVAFREADAPFFFGREDFTERLFQAVHERPLVAVIVGSSGSGKSSTVFAGLLPRIRSEVGWLIAGFRPGGQPFHTLAAALLPLVEPELSETDRLIETRKLADALSEGEILLLDIVERALEKSTGARRLLLLADQFEELYTLCSESETRRRFLEALLVAAEAASDRRASPFALLLTLRADFMGQALAHRPFADALQEASLIMGPMTREELRAAIEKPGEMQGVAFETGLVERLLDDVGEEPGNLPLLEFALTLLWERLDFGWMTHAAYEEIGRVEGALARYAEEVFDELEVDEREGARRVFVQLVQPGEGTEDTRRMATRGELGDESWSLLHQLADKRLVVTGRDPSTGNETVEVAHEALIQRWGQLRAWMEADRAFRTWQERLRAALRAWEASDQDEEALLRGAPLAEAQGWWAEREDELSEAETAYIQAGVALRERRQAERERRRRRAILVLAGGLVIALVLALLAGQQWQRAEDEVDARAAAEGQARFQAATAEAERIRAEAESEARATQQALAEGEAQARATAQAEAEVAQEKTVLQAAIGLAGHAVAELEGPAPEWAVPLALEALENYPYTWQAECALSQVVIDSKLRLILNHGRTVKTAEWSSDGTRVLTGGDDGTVRVWDANTGEELLALAGRAPVAGTWSPDDKHIFIGRTSMIQKWDAASGLQLWSQRTPMQTFCRLENWTAGRQPSSVPPSRTGPLPAPACELIFSRYSPLSPAGDRFLTIHEDDTARVWDADTGTELLTLRGHQDLVLFAEWSPAGDRIVTHGLDNTLKLWDASSGELLFTFPGDVVFYLQGFGGFSPSGDRFTIREYGAVKVFDTATGKLILTLPAPMNVLPGGALFSPDGTRISAAFDNAFRVWDAATGQELIEVTGVRFFGPNQPSDWSPSGDLVAVGWEDGSVTVWDVMADRQVARLCCHSTRISKVAWSPGGDRILATAQDNNDVKVYDLSTALLVLPGPPGSGDWWPPMDWSPSGDRLARSYDDGMVKVFDAVSGEELLQLQAHEGALVPLAWAPAGDRLLTGGIDGVAKVWDVRTGEQLLELTGHQFPMAPSSWSPSGDRLVTMDEYGIAKVWDATTGERLYTYYDHKGDGLAAWWSPVDDRIASTGWGGYRDVLDVWDPNVLSDSPRSPGINTLMRFSGAGQPVIAAAWSPDGKRLAAGGFLGGAWILDAAIGEILLTLEGHSGVVYWIEWSPSGERILTGCRDGIARVWDASTGAELHRYAIGAVTAKWSPDGTRIAISAADGSVRVYPAWRTTQELIDYAKECCLLRELTPQERVQFGLPER